MISSHDDVLVEKWFLSSALQHSSILLFGTQGTRQIIICDTCIAMISLLTPMVNCWLKNILLNISKLHVQFTIKTLIENHHTIIYPNALCNLKLCGYIHFPSQTKHTTQTKNSLKNHHTKKTNSVIPSVHETNTCQFSIPPEPMPMKTRRYNIVPKWCEALN